LEAGPEKRVTQTPNPRPQTPYKIAVVGFGMAGATSAYLLAKAGHAVTLFERSPVVGAVGAGILLQMSGQAILRHLGVLDRILAHAAPIDELHAVHVGGRDLIRNRYGLYAEGCRAYGLHRGVLFQVLENLVDSSGVAVRLGIEIAGRIRKADGTVDVTDTAGQSHGPFDFIVCGDGARSQLRPVLGQRQYSWKYSHGTLWAITPGMPVRGQLFQVVKGTKYLCGLVPMGDGLTTLYWGIPNGEYNAIRNRGIAALKEEIVEFCPQAQECTDHLFDFDQLLFTNYQHNYMSRRFDRNIVFLGDASHAMSPHLGQGVNLAMVDAWMLAGALADAPTPLEGFRLFERRQRGYQRYYSAATFFLSPFFQSDWPILGWGRDRFLPWMPRIPILRRQMLMTVAGLKGGFLKGARDFS